MSTKLTRLSRWWLRMGRWFTFAIILLGVGFAYLRIGSLLIEQTNHSKERILGGDQKNNLKLTLQTRDDLSPDWSKGVSGPIKNWFPHRTDGVVNPLWPWVAAWLADKDHTISADDVVTDQDRALYHRGRRFHVGWTLGILAVLGFACARVFSLGAAVNVMLLVGFGALLPRTAYFQPEPLFFVLFLVTWLACLFALQRNSLWMHLMIGGFGGLAYLAKGSVQPLLMGYAAVATLRWALEWCQFWRRIPKVTISLWQQRDHWLCMLVMMLAFFMTTGPRLYESSRLFGSPFHSFPAYWMWFDNWEDGSCYRWMSEHNTAAELATLTPETTPSLSKYLREHTQEQAIQRLREGTKAKVMELLWPGLTPPASKDGSRKPWKGVLELRGVYLGLIALVPLLLGVSLLLCRKSRPVNAAQRLHPESFSMALLVIGLLVGYSLLYGWYHPIGRGDRFMLSLYAPLVLSLVWAGEAFYLRAKRRSAPLALRLGYHLMHWGIAAFISYRLVELLQWPYFRG
jgi:hypothetical protein